MILYIDCDTGVDDAVALALLAGRPEVQIAGIGTTSGNTSAAQAATNTLAVLALAGRDDIPVAIGGPPGGDYRGGAEDVHGSNGIGGVDLPPAPRGPIDGTAADLLVNLARAHPGELLVLATGPMTNLAAALRLEPRLPELVAGVTAMGGAVRVPGNVTPRAEANIADDPESAAVAVAAPWPMTLVPLDVTLQHRFTERDLDALRSTGSPLLTALADMLATYFDYYEPLLGARESPLHDPLAAAVLLGLAKPGDAPMLPLRVDDGDGPDRGRVLEDPAGHPVRVILSLAEPAAPAILGGLLATAF